MEQKQNMTQAQEYTTQFQILRVALEHMNDIERNIDIKLCAASFSILFLLFSSVFNAGCYTQKQKDTF